MGRLKSRFAAAVKRNRAETCDLVDIRATVPHNRAMSNSCDSQNLSPDDYATRGMSAKERAAYYAEQREAQEQREAAERRAREEDAAAIDDACNQMANGPGWNP